MQLNKKQEEAKNKVEWSLLIIAWAWSWKTATLTARVEYMIKEKWINPSSILMVTFTNKAAKEMRERVSKKLWIEPWRNIYSNRRNLPLLWTFHSIWILMLKETLSKYDAEELNIWLKKDFVIYDESDKKAVLKWIYKELLIEEKEYPIKMIASYISNAKNALITAKAYEGEIDSNIKEIVFKVYLVYEKKLKQNNAMDFDDILVKTLALLRVDKVLSEYQELYKYIMVDEYQDTNSPQYNIVKLLSNRYWNIAVVWDDSQSIYSWRWADMRNILNFKKDYPEALIVKLEQNYRSTKNILNSANAVIMKNSFWMKKELWTENVEGNKISYIESASDKSEAKAIVEIIKEKGWDYKDNLILYRTNAQSRQLEEALIMQTIPYRVVWWLKFYDRKEIKDLLAYLRVILNPNDIISTKRIINVPTRKIWAKSIEIIDNYKENFWINYFWIIENVDEVEELKPLAKKWLKIFFEIYETLVKTSFEKWVWELIEDIIRLTWYKDYLFEWLTIEEKESKQDNINELLNVASEYNWMEPRESLSQFLEEVALITDMDTKDERNDYVTLMTIHTSKWLEEKRVFLTWLEDGIFPSFRSVNDNFALEEERRLMYVAMTRAREELFISRAIERFHFWDYVRNPVSRFIAEIPEAYIEKIDSLVSNNFLASSFEKKMISNDTWTTQRIKVKQYNDVSKFNMWDKVNHPKFWNGIITELSWELASIAFSWKWIKKMNIKIAPVRKI